MENGWKEEHALLSSGRDHIGIFSCLSIIQTEVCALTSHPAKWIIPHALNCVKTLGFWQQLDRDPQKQRLWFPGPRQAGPGQGRTTRCLYRGGLSGGGRSSSTMRSLPVCLGMLASEHLGVEATTAQKGLGFPFKNQRNEDRQPLRGSGVWGTRPCISLLPLRASSILPREGKGSQDARVSRRALCCDPHAPNTILPMIHLICLLIKIPTVELPNQKWLLCLVHHQQ